MRFYTTVKVDARKVMTKGGHRNVSSTLNGWESGVRVAALIDPVDGKDIFRIYSTGGSNGHTEKLIGTVKDGQFFREMPSFAQAGD